MPTEAYRQGMTALLRQHPEFTAHLIIYYSADDKWDEHVYSSIQNDCRTVLDSFLRAVEPSAFTRSIRDGLLRWQGTFVLVLILPRNERLIASEAFAEMVESITPTATGFSTGPQIHAMGASNPDAIALYAIMTMHKNDIYDIISRDQSNWPFTIKSLTYSTCWNYRDIICSVEEPDRSAAASAYEGFTSIAKAIDVALKSPTGAFETLVASVEGENYGSLEENRRISAIIQDVADRLRVSFACVKCGEPSRFRCSESTTVPTGVFVFSHDRKTHGGTPIIPALKLTPPMVDRRKTREDEEN